MKQSLVLASNDLQDIERGTGTCSRIFPSLFRDPFFQMSFYKCITAMGKCQFRRGENGRDGQQKYPLSICTWHMARSALSSRRTVTHLEVQVPKKLLSRCQRSYTALSGSGEQQVASMPLCTSCSSSLGIPGPGAKEAILHCLDPESICSRLPRCLSVHRAHHHLGSQVQVPKKLYCMVWIQRAHAAGCLNTCDPVEANDFTPRNSAAQEHFDHARPQSLFSCCCSL
jgi:hypothetical protein